MGGYVYHVLNRTVGRTTLFYKEGDYAAFDPEKRKKENRDALRKSFVDIGTARGQFT